MSYTLSLFRAAPGADLLEAARLDWQDEEADPDPIVELTREEQHAIADRLCALEPRVKAHRDSDGIDLDAPEDAHYVPDFEVFPRGVLAYFPGVGTTPEPTCKAARETLAMLACIAREYGLAIYDPQRDALVDAERDADTVADAALAGHVESDRRLAATGGDGASSKAVGAIVLLAIVMVAIQLGLPDDLRNYGLLAVPLVLVIVAAMMLRAKATPRR